MKSKPKTTKNPLKNQERKEKLQNEELNLKNSKKKGEITKGANEKVILQEHGEPISSKDNNRSVEVTYPIEQGKTYFVVNTGYWQEPYPKMTMTNFHILRPPSTRKYIRMVRKLKQLEQDELDKRWTHWHDTFKRKILYRGMNLMMKIVKGLELI